MKKYAICIGREFCSGGREIGKMLAKRLGIAYYDEIELRDRSRDLGIEDGIFELRSKVSNDITRIFYFFVIGQKIILQTGIMPGAEPVRIVDVSN